MKTHNVEGPVALYDLSKQVKPGFIRLMSAGKPIAYVLLASEYDEEDIAYMTDPDFWKMINERRKSDAGITLDVVMANLEKRERAAKRRAIKARKAHGPRRR